MLFEPEQAWLHEVLHFEREKQTNHRHPVLYPGQSLRQVRIFPIFARRA